MGDTDMPKRIARLLLFTSCLAFASLAHADSVLYKNGPINGICDIEGCTVDAWTINFGFEVTDSFTISSASTIHGFNFALWLYPGDTLSSVDWAFGTCPFCSDAGSGTASGSGLSSSFMFTNQYGFNVWDVSVTGLDVHVIGGPPQSYWLTLQNATVPSGDPVYWDENNGPSSAETDCIHNYLGCIPSESFNIVGTPDTGTTPEPSSILLLTSGMIALSGAVRRKRL
jgi:hypothetical protein